MLMMVPLAVVFGLASQAGSALDWKIWVGCLCVGSAPAIGALVGGWRGMKRGLGWLALGWFLVLNYVLLILQFIQSEGLDGTVRLTIWVVGSASLALGGLALINVIVRRLGISLPQWAAWVFLAFWLMSCLCLGFIARAFGGW